VHPPSGTGAPFTTFFKGESKIALKCSALDEGSLEPKGVASWDFATWRAARWGWQRRCNFWGHRPPPLKIWEGKKRAKIGAIYDNFRVWAPISLKPMKIATICKRLWRKRSFGRWIKKILWNLVHYEQSYQRSCWPPLSRQCAFGVYQCIWVRATWLWCRGNFTPPANFPQSDLGRRADSRWALPQISSW